MEFKVEPSIITNVYIIIRFSKLYQKNAWLIKLGAKKNILRT